MLVQYSQNVQAQLKFFANCKIKVSCIFDSYGLLINSFSRQMLEMCGKFAMQTSKHVIYAIYFHVSCFSISIDIDPSNFYNILPQISWSIISSEGALISMRK